MPADTMGPGRTRTKAQLQLDGEVKELVKKSFSAPYDVELEEDS